MSNIVIFLIVLGIVNFLCGIFSAAIAKSKGRNVSGWFVCGFLLNLAGMLFALIIEPNYDELVRNRVRKRCPFCLEIIQIEALKCPHCTTDLQDPNTYPKR